MQLPALELHQVSFAFKQAEAIRLSQFNIPASMLFLYAVAIWLSLSVSQVVYQVTAWLPIKNETRVLNYRLALLAIMAALICRCPPSLSPSLFGSPHFQLASLSPSLSCLLKLPSSASLHFSGLTAITHWTSSLCLLPSPRVQPSHNYFLWFTVVGHCHLPKVFTAEITHTVFSNSSIIVHFIYRLC